MAFFFTLSSPTITFLQKGVVLGCKILQGFLNNKKIRFDATHILGTPRGYFWNLFRIKKLLLRNFQVSQKAYMWNITSRSSNWSLNVWYNRSQPNMSVNCWLTNVAKDGSLNGYHIPRVESWFSRLYYKYSIW